MAGRETPATRALEAEGVVFELREYEHDPAAGSYALEAADALGLDPDSVFKTLVVDRDGMLAACLVPSAHQLDTRALGKRVALAQPDRAEKVTGYVTGGISPFGQRRPLPTFVDETVELLETVWVSGGRRGLEIGVAPADLVEQLGAQVRAIAREGS
jgi:Cys-tRNA(Pro)/Cys-tRNA(Cys) deacylase